MSDHLPTLAFGGPSVDSFGRAEHLLRVMPTLTSELRWKVFLLGWPSCDGVDRRTVLGLMKYLKPSHRKHMRAALDEDAAELFDSLPERVTIYRGCCHSRVQGFSWTTDIELAKFFAPGTRWLRSKTPGIATGTVARKDIFAVFAARRESEVMVDPAKVKITCFQEYRP